MGKKARETVVPMTWEKFGEGVLKVCEEFDPRVHNVMKNKDWVKAE